MASTSRRHYRGAAAALLLLFLGSCASGAEKVAYVAEPGSKSSQPGLTVSLVDALKDPDVQRIVLTGNYSIRGELDTFEPPLQISRNVTVSGLPGQEQPVLDLAFAHAILQLCSSCMFVLDNITVANERLGTGPTFDAFVGERGSRLLPRHIHRLHLVCTVSKEAGETVADTPRSKLLPRPKAAQQLRIQDVMFRGRAFPGSLVYADVTFDVPRMHEERAGASTSGGYALGCTEGVRLCEHYVSDDCLATMSADTCVIEATNNLLSSSSQQLAPSGPAPGVLAAAIVVPLVVLGALVALGAVWWRRRQRRRRGSEQLPVVKAPVSPGPTEPSKRASMDLQSNRDSLSLIRSPMGMGKGWQLASTLTSPLIGPVEDDTIDFGDLLGSGSFGRVFVGRWAGRTVAIKVIEHDSSTLAAVENEFSLMMSFNHDNVVRAYHSCTYTHTPGGSNSEYSSSSFVVPQSSSGGAHSSARSQQHQQYGSSGRGRRSSHGSERQQPPDAGGQAWPQRQQRSSGSGGGGGGMVAGPALGSSSSCRAALQANRSSQSGQESQRAETFLIEEFCDLGTLGNYMARWEPALPTSSEAFLRLLLLLRDAAQGLQVLHKNCVVHGDLNARNVLISSSEAGQFGVVAKVSDLGLSRVIKQHETHRTTNTVGTLSHMPPELLRYGRMSPACDIYAFGIMMWELYTGQPAFRKLQYGQFFETVVLRNLRPLIPSGMPADFQLLMEHCWATDADNRPNVDRLLECIKFMIQERQQDAAVRDSSACSLTHSKSAPSPMSLLKPLPPRPAPPQAPGGRESGRDSSSGSLSAVVLGASNGFQQLQDGDSSAQLPPAGYSGQQQQDGAAGGTAASTGGGVHPRQALVPGSSPSAGAEWTATTPKPEHSWFV